MPIRFRLTLWYCLIFGLLLVAITTLIYFAHRNAHYNDIDRLLTSLSYHIEDDLNREARMGKELSSIKIDFDQYYLEGVSFVVKDGEGTIYQSSKNYDPTIERPNIEMPKLGNEYLSTFQYPGIGPFRMLIRPITLTDHRVIYIQEETPLKRINFTFKRFKLFVFAVTALGLVLAAFAGWFLAKQALRRIGIISQTARTISASQEFSQRVLHEGPKDELGELVETFNGMLTSLEKAYMSQRRFIADASHELRAPLTTIRGNLDILKKSNFISKEDQQEIIEDMRSESIRMSKLVAELLSLARTDVGQEVNMKIVNVSKIVHEVNMEIQAWDHNITIDCKAEEGVTTWGNEDLLKQLILILMENAIKYTPDLGRVTLHLFDEENDVVIVVEDTGIGITEDEMPFIFERFYRSNEARMKSPDGTGLGLSIAKSIIDQHNGSITVKSVAGTGSTFRIRLPRIKK